MRRLRTRLRTTTSTVPAPSLYLDFISGASFDPRITFSRGSQATLVDSTGKLTYAPNNLLVQSQTFDNAAWTKTNATVSADTAVAPDGTTTADKLVETATTGQHLVNGNVVASNMIIVYSVYAKAAERTIIELSGAGFNAQGYTAKFDLSNGTMNSNTGGKGGIVSVGNGWYRCYIAFAPSTGGNIGIYLCDATGANSYAGNGTSGAFIWGAQLEQVTYQTTPSTYNATTASAYYGPRFDYDPVTLAPKGLLIEEQRTNLFIRSEEFDTATWNKSGASVTANAVASPDGTVDADALVENAATSSHFCQQFFTGFTSGVAYTMSVYVKPDTRTWVEMFLPSAAFGVGQGGYFNLSGSGSLGNATGTPTNRTITAIGNGWYRITVTATATATAGGNCVIAAASANGTTSYAGNSATALYLYGAQLEAGAFATSYIPTVASTVTRSADVATMTGTNFSSWYNPNEGTFVADFDTVALRSGGVTTHNVVNANDGTANNNVSLFASAAFVAGQVSTGGVSQAYIQGGGSPTNNTPLKIAIGYATNNVAVTAFGGTPTVDTSATMPTSLNQLGIGGFASFSLLNGHIRAIAYYNTRLPNSQLQRLTQ